MKIADKVLIALDNGPNSQKVAEAGYALAKSIGAEVVLLHILTESVYYFPPELDPVMGLGAVTNFTHPEIDILDEIKKTAQIFIEKAKQDLNDPAINTLIKEGDTADGILETAKDLKADIIVMGTHSRKWLEQILMGSVTKEVLNNTTTPLYIIPTRKMD